MAPPPDSFESRELRWQFHTKAGNQRMQATLYQEAHQSYHRALELAESLLEEAITTMTHPDAIHPYVVSCHNLADSWLDLGDELQAESSLRRALEQTIQVMTNKELSGEIRLEAYKALRVVSFELSGFYQKTNQAYRSDEVIARVMTLAQSFLAQITQHPANLEDLQLHQKLDLYGQV